MGVKIISGSERVTSDGAIGSTVGNVRSDYADVLNIPGDATPTVNGKAAPSTYVLKDKDELSFNRPLGQKG